MNQKKILIKSYGIMMILIGLGILKVFLKDNTQEILYAQGFCLPTKKHSCTDLHYTPLSCQKLSQKWSESHKKVIRDYRIRRPGLLKNKSHEKFNRNQMEQHTNFTPV
jgi:hypothetical protein